MRSRADVATDCCDVCIAQQYAPRDFMDVNEFIEIDEATHLERNSNANAKGGGGGRKQVEPKLRVVMEPKPRAATMPSQGWQGQGRQQCQSQGWQGQGRQQCQSQGWQGQGRQEQCQATKATKGALTQELAKLRVAILKPRLAAIHRDRV